MYDGMPPQVFAGVKPIIKNAVPEGWDAIVRESQNGIQNDQCLCALIVFVIFQNYIEDERPLSERRRTYSCWNQRFSSSKCLVCFLFLFRVNAKLTATTATTVTKTKICKDVSTPTLLLGLFGVRVEPPVEVVWGVVG